ncbi:hypothetical protein VIGAN_06043000 [Vigna angularis var. angularis]|uniref:Uncharacterized protein n=1 Tax=Vigna angularis var. angularis TaxID=157739 RepID=A0A0S3S9D4_PHAAN|nr:hypothetical protein VIGAN_06043000 [Vigna angularis var. angularis]
MFHPISKVFEINFCKVSKIFSEINNNKIIYILTKPLIKHKTSNHTTHPNAPEMILIYILTNPLPGNIIFSLPFNSAFSRSKSPTCNFDQILIPYGYRFNITYNIQYINILRLDIYRQ